MILKRGDILDIATYDDGDRQLRRIRVKTIATQEYTYSIVGVNLRDQNSRRYTLPKAQYAGELPLKHYGGTLWVKQIITEGEE